MTNQFIPGELFIAKKETYCFAKHKGFHRINFGEIIMFLESFLTKRVLTRDGKKVRKQVKLVKFLLPNGDTFVFNEESLYSKDFDQKFKRVNK